VTTSTHNARNRFFSLPNSSPASLPPFLCAPDNSDPSDADADAEAFGSSKIVHSQAGYWSSGKATGSGWSFSIESPLRTVPAGTEEMAERRQWC
jgi:hypothetical protein